MFAYVKQKTWQKMITVLFNKMIYIDSVVQHLKK